MKGIISKYLTGEITLEEAIQHHLGMQMLVELIKRNEETEYGIETLGKATGLSPQISTIIKKLEQDGYIIIRVKKEGWPKSNPPKIALPTSKLLKLKLQQ